MSPAADASNLGMASWPDSLKTYVTRSFASVAKSGPKEKSEMETMLKNMIMDKIHTKTLYDTNWGSMPLPKVSALVKPIQKSPAFVVSEKPVLTKPVSIVPLPHKKPLQRPPSVLAVSPEERMKQERLKRFQTNSPIRSESSISYTGNLVGTCTVLEKRYLRLTSAPDPSTVRPLFILKKAVSQHIKKYESNDDYIYLCDQMKSVRQDLTVQRIRDSFTIYVYEVHARIALKHGDLGEFNQCQTQLFSLYKEIMQSLLNKLKHSGIPSFPELEKRIGNISEFVAYQILYLCHTRQMSQLGHLYYDTKANRPDEADFYFRLSSNSYLTECPQIKLVTRIKDAVITRNYATFFQCYNNLQGHQTPLKYLVELMVHQQRCGAFLAAIHAYRPTLSLEYVQKLLSLNLEQLDLFLDNLNEAIVYTQDELGIDTKETLPLVKPIIEPLLKRIDIKGQI